MARGGKLMDLRLYDGELIDQVWGLLELTDEQKVRAHRYDLMLHGVNQLGKIRGYTPDQEIGATLTEAALRKLWRITGEVVAQNANGRSSVLPTIMELHRRLGIHVVPAQTIQHFGTRIQVASA